MTGSKLTIPEYSVPVDQLRVGVFVRIDGFSWFNHPFLFKSFKIKTDDQINTLKELGITHVVCIPEKSDLLPIKAGQVLFQDQPNTPIEKESATDRLWQIKKERFERLKEKKKRIIKCEKKYSDSLNTINKIMKNIAGGNLNDMPRILTFTSEMLHSFLPDKESTLHLMNATATEDKFYNHSLNVAVLSMMLGKELGLNLEQMSILGTGSLLHDIGKSRIDKRILLKKKDLTKAESAMLKMHPKIGVETLAKVKEGLPRAVFEIVFQHHEFCDGNGYPSGLQAYQINELTKIVTIANTYDNYCNRPDPKESLTPYQALSLMFSKQRRLFEHKTLATFVRCLGIFPPGSVVGLSNGAIGIVVSVNPKDPLHPSVLIYDPEVPKEEAIIIDLQEEPELKVEKAVKPARLPDEIYEYLNPQTRVTYFVDSSTQSEARK